MRGNIAKRHVILSGCSGGGKSTLLAELKRRGYETVEEPGRRIVAQEMHGQGRALPWVDLELFASRAIEMASFDRARVEDANGWVFFDRGLVDAAVALEHAAGVPVAKTLTGLDRFHHQVFLTPPWPEIYRSDGERQLNLVEGIAEYHRLFDAFEGLRYDPVILPKVDVEARADYLLERLS
ncbi:AAA family ATPase [Pseudooceanicola spongiae]|uniref:AAA family ATPase n=1 Tax=Pseudooceanicola spongiae TaxID=2613965 RepID=A0A7L9WRT8_9RHOB|nr:AAA family ATPase [Pseudooceanicola spongiae]QOL82643.1 AAA family ATPase [Pseudooceanicola spongiae]